MSNYSDVKISLPLDCIHIIYDSALSHHLTLESEIVFLCRTYAEILKKNSIKE